MNKSHSLGAMCACFLVIIATTTKADNNLDNSEVFSVITYDNLENSSGYTLANYLLKWANSFGLGEMDPAAHGDTRTFGNGQFSFSAAPFLTSFDFSVFDHIKYLAVGTQNFDI